MSIPDQKELTQAPRAGAVAAFLLDAADSLNIKVATNGVDVITVSTTKVPFETIRWLEAELAKHKRAVIAAILGETAGRSGAAS